MDNPSLQKRTFRIAAALVVGVVVGLIAKLEFGASDNTEKAVGVVGAGIAVIALKIPRGRKNNNSTNHTLGN